MDRPAGNIQQFTVRSRKNFENRALHHHIFDFDLIVKSLVYFDFTIFHACLFAPFHQIVFAYKQDESLS